jgi:hypothetical protein
MTVPSAHSLPAHSLSSGVVSLSTVQGRDLFPLTSCSFSFPVAVVGDGVAHLSEGCHMWSAQRAVKRDQVAGGASHPLFLAELSAARLCSHCLDMFAGSVAVSRLVTWELVRHDQLETLHASHLSGVLPALLESRDARYRPRCCVDGGDLLEMLRAANSSPGGTVSGPWETPLVVVALAWDGNPLRMRLYRDAVWAAPGEFPGCHVAVVDDGDGSVAAYAESEAWMSAERFPAGMTADDAVTVVERLRVLHEDSSAGLIESLAVLAALAR